MSHYDNLSIEVRTISMLVSGYFTISEDNGDGTCSEDVFDVTLVTFLGNDITYLLQFDQVEREVKAAAIAAVYRLIEKSFENAGG